MTDLRLVPNASSPCPETDDAVTVASLAQRQGVRVAGQYIVTAERQCDAGVPHLQITLADASGTILGFVWPEHRQQVELPRLGAPVNVVAEVRVREGKPELSILDMAPVTVDNVAHAADLLVGASGPVLAALRRLEVSLPPILKSFFARVLLDPNVGPAFLTCRASANHHHASRGGLLQHSVENLDLIRAIVRRTLPDDPVSVGVAALGYLFHDIGKIRTVGPAHRPPLYQTVRHETHNLLVLAPHLAWLHSADPAIHAALTYVLEYVATPAPMRTRPKYFPAEVVVQFDQWSAAAYSARGLAAFLSRGPASGQRPRSAPGTSAAQALRGCWRTDEAKDLRVAGS